MVKRIGIELGRALLAAIVAIALTWSGVVVASSVSGGGGTVTIGSLGSGTSAELRAALTDESGTGAAIFANGDIGTATGTRLTLTSTVDALTATTNGSGGSYAINASGGSTVGNAGQFTATNGGYALVLTPDTTSPVRAPLLIQAQDASPTGIASQGTIYVHTNGVLRIAKAAGTPGVYASTANSGITATAAAAGANQAAATALTAGSDFYQVTGGSGTNGVTLTQGGAGSCLRIMNASSSAVLVYGHNSDNDTINGGAADAAFTHPANASLTYCTSDGTAWLTY